MSGSHENAAWPMLMSRLSIRHMQFLDKVAETQNILGAARALNMTQPAVSRAVHEVERLLGVQLFQRKPRGVVMTPEGEVFVSHARAVLNEMRAAWQGIADLDRANAGQIAIGSLPNGASGPLPRTLIEVRRQRPGIRIAVYEGLYDQMIPRLREGQLDFVIGRLNQHRPDPALATKRLFRQSWAIFARSGHPLAGAAGLGLRQLVGQSWILPVHASPIRPMIESLFLREGLALPAERIEMSALGLSRSLLLDSDTVMFLPRGTYQSDEETGRLVVLDVTFEQPEDSVGLFWRRGHQRTPAEAYFLGELQRIVTQMGLD